MDRRSLLGIALCGSVLLVTAAQGEARMLGQVGALYPIAERDALEEIEERVRRVDWDKVLTSPRPANYRPQNPVHLMPARQNRIYLIDPSYRLEQDLFDGQGRVLYPAGYTFNPLDFLTEVPRLVVIDGNNPLHLDWLEQLPDFAGDPQTLLLITDGDTNAISQRLQRRIFYVDQVTAERLSLSFVPCIMTRQGRYLEVQEYALQPTTD